VTIKIALLQIEIPDDITTLEDALDKAAGKGADYAILPEMFYGGFNYKTLERRAKEFGEISNKLSMFAANAKMGIIGTTAEFEDGKIYNSMLYIDKNGLLRKKQRKHFLFKPTGEEKYFSSGTQMYAPVKLEESIFGGAICYELRFPEIFRKQAFKKMQIAVIPAQWPGVRIEHWKCLIRARAIENFCFFIGVNATGSLYDMALGGNSMVAGPDGKILKVLGKSEEVATVEININEIYNARKFIPSLNEAKKERFYGDN